MPENSKKPRHPNSSISSHPVLVAVVAAALTAIFGYVVFLFERPKPSDEEALTAISEQSHTYSFMIDGHTISGESRAPFEKANGYYARVEACDRVGVEGITNIVSCYISIRPTRNMTISNSENSTSAVYTDGRPAVICCMLGEDFHSAPLYRIKLPPGDVMRRTYQRGSEVHLMLNVPGSDEDRQLDAISFSPGEGVAPALFPIGDRMHDHVFSAAFIREHKDNPAVQKAVQGAISLKADIEAGRKGNQGLTYTP